MFSWLVGAHSALRVEHWRNGHGRPWRKQRQGQKGKTKKGSAESEREEEGEGPEKEEQIGGSRPSCWCSRKRLYGIAATWVLWYQDCPTRKSIQTPSITHQRFQRGGARRPATDSSGRWCMNRRGNRVSHRDLGCPVAEWVTFSVWNLGCIPSTKRNTAAASHDILERARCNSNAPELASPTHTPHRAVRFALIRSSRADLRAAASFRVTSPPVPKNISSGVCPWNAEWGITSLLALS